MTTIRVRIHALKSAVMQSLTSLRCDRRSSVAEVDAAHRLKCETGAGAATVTPPPLSTCVSITPACAQTMMLCVMVFQHLLNYAHLHHLYNDDYDDDED